MAILPSFLENVEHTNFEKKFYNNVTLKIGQVLRINYPDTSKPQSDQVITYDVFINESSLDGQSHSIIYKAIVSNLFGGVADFCDYTLRPNVDAKDNNGQQLLLSGLPITEKDYTKILGSSVIVACVNGSPSDSVIIGAIPNYLTSIVNKNYTIPTEETGHFLNFMFNGVNININKLGELFIQRQGATTSAGGYTGVDASERNVNEEKSNSFIKINQDGEIILSTTTKKDTNNLSKDKLEHSVVIDKEGNINIRIDDGQTLEIKNNAKDTLMTLGTGGQSATISEEMEKLYNRLISYIQNATVATGMGPSGPIAAASGDAPPWEPHIASECLKLPK